MESWPWLLKLPVGRLPSQSKLTLTSVQRALQWFRREPEKHQQRDIRLYTELLNDVKIRMEKGTAPDCLASQALVNEGYVPNAEGDKVKKRTMTELEIAYAVSTPFGAGIETVRHLLQLLRPIQIDFILRLQAPCHHSSVSKCEEGFDPKRS